MSATSRSRIFGSISGGGPAGERTAIAPPVRPRARPAWLVPSLITLVAVGGVGLAWQMWPAQLSISQRALAFNERDWILITDFKNLTGDPVFD